MDLRTSFTKQRVVIESQFSPQNAEELIEMLPPGRARDYAIELRDEARVEP